MESDITIREIAKACHVGVSTVSRALNNHPDINQKTKDKIMKAIQDYGYVPNNAARNLKRSDGKTVAVLIKGITNPFFSDMVEIFESKLQAKGYTMTIQHVDEHQDEANVAYMLEKEKKLNGIIFLGGIFSNSEERLDRITVPFVFSTVGVTDSVNHRRYAYVSVNDVKESRRMVEYPLRIGRDRIAILCASGQDQSIGSLRLRGYLEALKGQGIPMDEKLICRPSGAEHTYSYENGYQSVTRLIESGTEFNCIYAISDTIAIGAMRALHDAGLRIPEDVAVAGFDGISTGRYTMPSLTTIKQPDHDMAEETIEALFDQIDNPELPKRHRLCRGELVVGEST